MKLPGIDQGIHKHAIQKKEEFLAFLKKKLSGEKEKKSILVYPGLRYAHKKNVWGKFQNYFTIKKMLLIDFSFMEIVWLAFFENFFYSVRYIEFYAKIRKKSLRKIDDANLAKCMKSVWVVFFQILSLWNCMISIFGLWRSTRVSSQDFAMLAKLKRARLE